MCVSVLLPVLLWTLAGAPAGAQADRQDPVHASRHGRVLRVPPDDPLTAEILAYLERHSPTARELLAALESLEDTVLIVRAQPLLQQEAHVPGRSRFWVVNGRLFGLLEYQAERRGSGRARRAVAHELGHALEVAVAPRARDTKSQRAVLLGTRRTRGALDRGKGGETDFAGLVEYRVQQELSGRPRPDDGLHAAARAAGLRLPPAAAVAMAAAR